MANPSLQIGNSNWAIKEDDLLGYSTVGTNFLPIETTMTRASAGTRVNSAGLVEIVELLGSEQLTDGNFPSGTTAWTVSDGTVSFDNGATFDINSKIYQLNALVTGKIYKATYEITDNVGGMTLRFYNGGAYFYVNDSVGVHTVYFTALPANTRFYINTQTGTSLTLKSVSLKEAIRNDLARVDYDGSVSSLLAEPQRTNEVTYSEDFSNASWTKTGASVVSGNTSPDGTANAYKLIEDTSTGSHFTQSITTVSNATIYTASIFIKYAGREWVRFTDAQSSNRVHFNTLTGVFGVITGTVIDYNSTALGEGWYKLSFTTTSVATAYTPRVELAEADGDVSYTGDGTSGVYIWGAQLEEGSYATSYIPTDGGTVTRVQDQYAKTGISNKINSEEGVLFVEMDALSDDGTDRRISISDGSASNRIIMGYSRFTGNIIAEIFAGGVLQTPNWGATGVTQADNNKFAFSWGSGTMKFYVNGSQTNTDPVTSPSGLSALKLSLEDDSQTMFAKVKQLQIFKTALTDSELETLTT